MVQLTYARNLYVQRRWYNLVPDFNREIVTAGCGEFPAGAEWKYDWGTATATAAAATPDGRLTIAYMERNRDTTVNMKKMAGPTTAQWFNPTAGVYSTIAGSPLANTGSHVFTPPGSRRLGAYPRGAINVQAAYSTRECLWMKKLIPIT